MAYVEAMQTVSEIQFEEYCDANGIRWEKIPTEDVTGSRTPDYYIHPNGQQVVAEVREVGPSTEEMEQARQLETKGWSEYGGTPGARIRDVISTAGKQIRAKAKGRCPAIIVVFNPSR
jgi:hypothetical protein